MANPREASEVGAGEASVPVEGCLVSPGGEGGLPRHAPQRDELLALYYDHRAAEMEEAYTCCAERAHDIGRLREALPRLVAGLNVLELACGTGYWTQVMASSARGITAVDISAAMLDLARRKDYGACPVTFLQQDLWQLQCFESGFDAAIALFWWSHVPHSRLPAFLAELCMLVRPGGLVAMVDNLPGDSRRTAPVGVDDDGNLYQRRRLRSGEEFEIIKNYPSREELLAVVRGGGLRARYTRFRCLWLLTCRTPSDRPRSAPGAGRPRDHGRRA